MRRLAFLAGFAVALAGLPGEAGAQPADRMRMTSASNVRVRVGPSVEVAIAGTLPLGVDLVELAASASGEWVRVRTPDGLEGWISTPLTTLVPPGSRLAVIEEIAAERSRRSFGFAAAVELISLIEAAERDSRDAEQRARLALYRLRALRDAAWTTWIDSAMPDDMRAWFRARPDWFAYNEPGGRWMLRYDAIMKVHDLHRGTEVAHDLAWLAVANGLGGECEGDVACYAERANRVEGSYLRAYPAGGMRDAALRRLLTASITWRTHQQDPRRFVVGRDCGRLRGPLAELQAAVTATVPLGAGDDPLKAEVLRLLNLIAQPCGSLLRPLDTLRPSS